MNSTSIKHPNTFSLVSGETSLVKYLDSINQSIRLILTTSRGELFGDPAYGTNLKELIFEFAGVPLETAIREEIVRVLNLYEKRIFISEEDIDITYDGKDKRTVIVDLRYNLRYTDYTSSYRQIISSQEVSRNNAYY